MPYIEQIYTKCLAEAAYYVESEGEALIIDPMRETQDYIEKANERGAKIKYVLETHFHADFVSGHVELARKTGATIVYGPGADTNYDIHIAQDGEVLKLGNVKIKVLHTPGHTLESSCYLIHDESDHPKAVFTGDTLFIGDVGRPDLAIKSDLTKEDLAGLLFDSLRNKLMVLPDEVLIYPAHGAGSSCGKNMSSETFDTLGSQKKLNYALQDISREDFIKQLTEGIMPAPQYFAANAMKNKLGYDDLENVMKRSNKSLDVDSFKKAWKDDVMVLDVRSIKAFPKSFIPGSVFVGLDGMFASWVGSIINGLDQKILLVVDPGRQEEAILRLARVGYENVIGYLNDGFESWLSAGLQIDSFGEVTSEELAELSKSDDLDIIDVRKPGEYENSHVVNAESFPLDFLNENKPDHKKDSKCYVYCKGGYRSLIASSLLRNAGYSEVVNVKGGFDALSKTNIQRTTQNCSG